MRAMYEYTKTVIGKVDFDNDLMEKELAKAKERLLPYEISELKIWFKDKYPNNNLIEKLN